jgi:hypothetical protein
MFGILHTCIIPQYQHCIIYDAVDLLGFSLKIKACGENNGSTELAEDRRHIVSAHPEMYSYSK